MSLANRTPLSKKSYQLQPPSILVALAVEKMEGLGEKKEQYGPVGDGLIRWKPPREARLFCLAL